MSDPTEPMAIVRNDRRTGLPINPSRLDLLAKVGSGHIVRTRTGDSIDAHGTPYTLAIAVLDADGLVELPFRLPGFGATWRLTAAGRDLLARYAREVGR